MRSLVNAVQGISRRLLRNLLRDHLAIPAFPVTGGRVFLQSPAPALRCPTLHSAETLTLDSLPRLSSMEENQVLMDYYQGVVVDYLRADRALFVNVECTIRMNPAGAPEPAGSYWICDAVAADFRAKTIFLCEVTYAKDLGALRKRLKGWHDNWNAVLNALCRDSCLPVAGESPDWQVRPWLFVPQDYVPKLVEWLNQVGNGEPRRFTPRITPLEMVPPWCHKEDRIEEDLTKKSVDIPEAMRV